MTKLDVIVTHYNEPSEIVNRFLNSLENQRFHDLKVTIVDDGMDCPEFKPYTYTGRQFSFEIEHLKIPHHTVSRARNFGLDNTTNDYLMFCDCDDVFYDGNRYGLEHAMKRIETNGLMAYRSEYISEVWKTSVGKQLSGLYSEDESTDELVYAHHSNNASNVHSKIYNRRFILSNGIRFEDDLYMNEDGVFNSAAFNICALLRLPCFTDCEEFYVWKYNSTSATRTNKLYPIKGYDQYIKATCAKNEKIKEACSKNGIKFSPSCVEELKFIFQAYYWLYLYGDRFSSNVDYDRIMRDDYVSLERYLDKFEVYVDFKLSNNEEFVKYSSGMLRRLDKCDISKKMSFEDWYNSIRNKDKDMK